MFNVNKLLLIFGLIFIAIALGQMAPSKVAAADCSPHTTKQCISNIVYWYNSCGALEDIYQNCNTTNQVCQNAQCVNKTPVNPPPPPTPPSSGTSHYTKACYNNNLYWYSSQGTLEEMFQNCSDSNQCTLDSCSSSSCQNQLKCDGSTCVIGSQDYVKYCGASNQNTITQNQTQIQGGNLVVSMFGKKESEILTWAKDIDTVSGDKINFLLIVKNSSNVSIDNVSIKTDLTNTMVYADNLTIDNVATTEDITTGINLGTILAKTSRIISFTASVAPQTSQNFAQITANIISGNMTSDSDYVTVNIAGNAQNSEAQAPATTTTGVAKNSIIDNFKKNWIVWLTIITILLVVFIIIFRRLSSKV